MRQVGGFRRIHGGLCSRVFGWVGACAVALPLLVCAAQVDISGPAGSVAFGTSVTVLPNGNFVVTDPNGPVLGVGAVYLYSPSGALISTLTGSSANDHVGRDGIVVVGANNFVVISTSWENAGASYAGAVTWVNGSTGLSGVVSASNSLVGTTASDRVGYNGVTTLSNGNYVVASAYWNNGVANGNYGAVTWGNGNSGIAGSVSSSNSLIGTASYDVVGVGGVTALSNGNYVVASYSWSNGGASAAGAVTWGNGSNGITGPVSTSNSLVGTTTQDYVGNGVVALSNGNYVVASFIWNDGVPDGFFGAATWGNGSSGITGAVSASNSLVGTATNDKVGNGGVTALSNGNYVVVSSIWNNDVQGGSFGATTWSNGSSGIIGPVSVSNSLIGTTVGDSVGDGGVTALNDGNYVVSSSYGGLGAATLASGAFRMRATIQPWNSVRGTAAGGSQNQTYAYDAARQRLIVGQSASNIVSLFSMDQIFASDFQP